MSNKSSPFSNRQQQAIRPKKQGNPVGKITKVAGKRAGGALRSEQARQQKRRDSKR